MILFLSLGLCGLFCQLGNSSFHFLVTKIGFTVLACLSSLIAPLYYYSHSLLLLLHYAVSLTAYSSLCIIRTKPGFVLFTILLSHSLAVKYLSPICCVDAYFSLVCLWLVFEVCFSALIWI